MSDVIHQYRSRFGIEPICKLLPIAPSTYCAHVGRCADPNLRSDRAKRDALEKALYDRPPGAGQSREAHSDRGSQRSRIRYTERPAEASIELTVGSVGDSHDNALAETISGLYKTEVIHRRR